MALKQIIKEILPPLLWKILLRLKNGNSKKVSGYGKEMLKLAKSNISLLAELKSKEVYIIGSGPSIKSIDMKLLSSKNVCALNNFFVHPDYDKIMSKGGGKKYHLLAPIHPPQSEVEWCTWLRGMNESIPDHVIMIMGVNSSKMNLAALIEREGLFKGHEIIWYFVGEAANFSPEDSYKKELFDVSKPLPGAFASSVYALIFCQYFEAQKIYLLGLDHDYFLHDDESQMRFYKKAPHQNNELERSFKGYFYTKEFLRQYKIFCYYEVLGKRSGAQIYNLSDRGVLRVFERMRYEDSF